MNVCYTPKDPGLGDFISTLQYCNATDKKYVSHVSTNGRCVIKDILSLFPNDLTVVEFCAEMVNVKPHWHSTDYFPYVKSNLLDMFKKKDHICASLISNGDTIFEEGVGRRLRKDVLLKIVDLVKGENVFNLSTNPAYAFHFNHKGQAGICDKFALLASAKMNISTDTGIAHLAAMTDTPTIVIGPPQAWNRYNGNDNIRYVTKIEDFVKVYDSLMQNKQ